MKTERKFILRRETSGDYFSVYSHVDDFVELFSRDEITFLGVPQEVFEATKKGPVTIKLTIEAL